MEQKKFPVKTRVTKKHLNAIGKMKPITIKPEENAKGEYELQIDFNSKALANKFNRNLAKGKGMRIKPEHFHEIHSQGGSLKSIGKAFKKAGSTIKKGIVKVGNEISSKTQDVVKAKEFKAVVKEIAPIVGEEIVRAGVTYMTGSPATGNVAGKIVNRSTSSLLKTSGWGLYNPTVGTGFVGAGDSQRLSADIYTKEGGINPTRPWAIPNSIMAERMAIVRSHRRTGGSFKPVGGSFAPVGGSFVPVGGSFK